MNSSPISAGLLETSDSINFDFVDFLLLLRTDGTLKIQQCSSIAAKLCIDKVNTWNKISKMDIYFEINGDQFVWSDEKAVKNWHKHGVRFEEAATVFEDPLFVLVEASRKDESRDAAIGFDTAGRLLYVVHIEFEASVIRIISARRAEPQEEIDYAN